MTTLAIEEFKANAIFRLDESFRMIQIACSKITPAQLWLRPVDNGMSLGNQLLHSAGNMRQYIVSSLGETKDNRQRNTEFSTREGATIAQLLESLKNTVEQAKQVIRSAPEAHFLKKRHVQGFSLSGIGVVLHAVEHFSYHTGQIAFWVKQLTKEDLGFYSGIDLTQKNN